MTADTHFEFHAILNTNNLLYWRNSNFYL